MIERNIESEARLRAILRRQRIALLNHRASPQEILDAIAIRKRKNVIEEKNVIDKLFEKLDKQYKSK